MRELELGLISQTGTVVACVRTWPDDSPSPRLATLCSRVVWHALLFSCPDYNCFSSPGQKFVSDHYLSGSQVICLIGSVGYDRVLLSTLGKWI